MRGSTIAGYLSISMATLFWGLSATIAKFLFKHNVDLLIIVQTRSTLSFIVLFLILLFFKREYLNVSVKDFSHFFLLGVVGIAGSNFTYYFTLNEINVATAIVMQYTAPILVVAYEVLTGKMKFGFLTVSPAFISVIGCALVAGIFDVSFSNLSKIGLISGVASSFCWAFFNIYGKKIGAKYNVWEGLVYSLMFAGMFWFFVNPPWKVFNAGYTPNDWLVFFIFAMLSVLIPYFFYFFGLRMIRSSSAIITSTLEPVVAIVSAWIVVGERLKFSQIVGVVLVLISVLLVQIKRERF